MQININKIFIGMGVLILILVGVIIYQGRSNNDLKTDMKAFQIAMSDSFKVSTNKYGQQIAEVKSAVFADASDTKKAIGELNQNGANIKSIVDANTQSLTLLDTKVGGLLKGKTTITGYDTVRNKPAGPLTTSADTGLRVYPIYKINDSTKWYTLNGNVYYDHYALTPFFKDSTELKAEFSYNGLFKPRVLTMTTLQKNPYSKTTGLKSIVIKKQASPIWTYLGLIGALAGGIFVGYKL